MKTRILIGYEGRRVVIQLESGKATLGREGAEIVLNDPHCSRKHALLYVTAEGRLHLRDLGSTNGTTVNGRRVEDSPVEVGNIIEAGNTQIAVLDVWTSLNILKGPQRFNIPPLPGMAAKNG